MKTSVIKIASNVGDASGPTFRSRNRIEDALTPELVIALCGPLGTPLHRVAETIKRILRDEHGYEFAEIIRLSNLIRSYGAPINGQDVESLIEAGNQLRQSHSPSILAQLAIRQIAEHRASFNAERAPDIQLTLAGIAADSDAIQPTPVLRHCHIIDSIKNKDELEHLRLVYGRLLHVIRVYSPLEVRVHELAKKLGGEEKVYALINRDSGEESNFGQSVREVFPMADFFLRVNEGTDQQIEGNLRRYLDLLLGRRVITPTPEERAMYAAHSAARNSACLSRQVGAAITDSDGQVLAVGWNDVPRAFGGLYESAPWGGEHSYVDHRCWQKEGGKCFNDEEKDNIATRLVHALVKEEIISPDKVDQTRRRLRHSGELRGLIEFSRAVHAEMHALLCAGEVSGAKIRGGSIFVTTYPCHSCARHIIAAGIRKVHFIEPYRKSLAIRLHSDAITENESDTSKVRIIPFDGVSPARFLDLFSEGARKRKDPSTGRRPVQSSGVPATAVTLEAITTLEDLTVRELQSRGLNRAIVDADNSGNISI